MSKKEYAKKLYVKFINEKNTQEIINDLNHAKIGDRILSIEQKLEIVDLIRQIHIEESIKLYESVDAFLDLVNLVEKEIKNTEKK